MANIRKYPKTEGYWIYAHVLPTKEVYIGMSKLQPCKRWKPSMYKTSTLAPYIEQYDWENIEHKVLIDSLTKEQAEQVEDWFICKATADGFCINQHRSGGLWRDDYKAYMKQYNKQYNEDHKNKKKVYMKDYDKQRNSTPEVKIYKRVANYNRNHTPIETSMEAKQKYLQWGYIPAYIKNDDL